MFVQSQGHSIERSRNGFKDSMFQVKAKAKDKVVTKVIILRKAGMGSRTVCSRPKSKPRSRSWVFIGGQSHSIERRKQRYRANRQKIGPPEVTCAVP